MYDPIGKTRFCRYCGANLSGEAAYCISCGRKTGAAEAAHPLAHGGVGATEGWRYASFWQRFLSLAIDVASLLAACYCLSFLVGLAWGLTVGEATESQINTLAGLALALALAGYFFYAWVGTASGGTLSQRLVGLRVVGRDTLEAPGMGRALIRVLMSMTVSTLFYCLGYLWATWDKEKQAWHDKAANTIVVRAEGARTGALVPTHSMQTT